MKPKAGSHVPQQARSRDSHRRILDAAEAVIDKHGLEGATLPRIAKAAKSSPANVYRRFRDKDALMRAVFARISDLNAEQLKADVNVEELRSIGIRQFSEMMIGNMITGFRTRTGLIRATILYSREHAHASFVKKQMVLEAAGFKKIVTMFLAWRDEIKAPDAEEAVSWAFAMVASTLHSLIVFDQMTMLQHALPIDDDKLREELPKMFLGYLGISQ
jgi:AcrR family transcriptional regulator